MADISSPRRQSRPLLTALITLTAIFVIIQFYRPEKTNPPVDPSHEIGAVTHMPMGVHEVLLRSCNDCHSNQTRWPWYSNVAPVMWLVRSDVSSGRRHMNFSEWSSYSRTRADALLENVCAWTQNRHMPMPIYLRMHSNASLSDSDIKMLCDWTTQERQRQQR